VKRPFEAQVAMCRAKNGELLTKKDQVLSRWKEHFEQHLDKGEERDQPPDQVNLRDDGVEIDLPSREEIKSALKYLKNNKAAYALEEVIQLAWTSETLPESWTKGVLCLLCSTKTAGKRTLEFQKFQFIFKMSIGCAPRQAISSRR
jgi:hypothetical protein